MKLDEQEKYVATSAVKALYATTPEDDKIMRFSYADILQRIENDALDIRAKDFLAQLADKILKHTEKLMSGDSVTEEALVRASVVKDVYARIKEKVANE